ncbi:tRNA pseudouridine(55) synthase TruB [Candidatus Parcubacteria bacterium]|nr:MAG: tRNA pseudouridine(55) synthase TruB [Candidatus Parcubacteria bacterium]
MGNNNKPILPKEGIVAVWKPRGISSHAVVDVVRRATGERKVGHAGTLDPLAEGVLVVGVGRRATRRLAEMVQKEKEYVATVHLGMVSATDDAEGPLRHYTAPSHPPSQEELQRALKKFCGVITQVPPRWSAVKVRGKEAYKRARAGEQFTLSPRKVHIREIALLDYRWPHVLFRAVTGPGVYIRSLARDLGRQLGTGGYLERLVRTRVGQYTAREAIPFAELDFSSSQRTGCGKIEKMEQTGYFRCPECGLFYAEERYAKQCEAWCRTHRSCNLAITRHAISAPEGGEHSAPEATKG